MVFFLRLVAQVLTAGLAGIGAAIVTTKSSTPPPPSAGLGVDVSAQAGLDLDDPVLKRGIPGAQILFDETRLTTGTQGAKAKSYLQIAVDNANPRSPNVKTTTAPNSVHVAGLNSKKNIIEGATNVWLGLLNGEAKFSAINISPLANNPTPLIQEFSSELEVSLEISGMFQDFTAGRQCISTEGVASMGTDNPFTPVIVSLPQESLCAGFGEGDRSPGSSFALTRTATRSWKNYSLDKNYDFASGFRASIVSTPVPAPLPLLGVAAAFGYSRKLRKRIKGSKKHEVISAIS